MTALKLAALSVAFFGVLTVPCEAQRGRNNLKSLPSVNDVATDGLLQSLQAGGFILACRHAITDRSGNQRRPFRLDDRSTQRNLSGAGEEQARDLGRALEALEIPIGEVHSSPMARTMESAQLAFGRASRDDLLYGNPGREELRARFNRRPTSGNTVLMTHQGILRSALGYREPGEGDCIVLRPSANRPEVVVNVTVAQWQRLAATTRR